MTGRLVLGDESLDSIYRGLVETRQDTHLDVKPPLLNAFQELVALEP